MGYEERADAAAEHAAEAAVDMFDDGKLDDRIIQRLNEGDFDDEITARILMGQFDDAVRSRAGSLWGI